MEYFNLHTSILRGQSVRQAEALDIQTWLFLQCYCIEQENSGRIAGMKSWTEKTCLSTIGVSRADLDRACGLWTWDEADLLVEHYPIGQEENFQKMREGGKAGGRQRQKQLKAQLKASAKTLPQAPLETTPETETKHKGKERKEKEEKGSSRAPEASAPPEDGTETAVAESPVFKKTAPPSEAELRELCAREDVPLSYARRWLTKLANRRPEALVLAAQDWGADLSDWWQRENLRTQSEFLEKEKSAPKNSAVPGDTRRVASLFKQFDQQRNA